jgi:hypothetical protein
MNSKPPAHVLMLIEDRIAMRDFLCTSLPRDLIASGEIRLTVASNFDLEELREACSDKGVEFIPWKRPSLDLPSNILFSLAKDLFVAYWPQLTFALRRGYATSPWNLWRRLRLVFAGLLKCLGLTPHGVVSWTRSFPGDPEFAQTLEKVQPDLVVYSCYFSRVVRSLREAQKRGIPIVFSVSSWDHLTTKGPLMIRPDHVFTWSEEMKQEVVDLHAIPPERVSIVGALYMDVNSHGQDIIPRDEYYRDYGIPDDCSIILYALGNKYVEYLNKVFIERLYQLIEANAFGRPCFLMVRANPKDPGHHYKEYESWPLLHIQYPGHLKPSLSASGRRSHSRDDDRVRVSTIHHSSVVVCTTSTIIFDACLMDKPVVNIMYDAEPNLPEKFSARRYLKFKHAESVIQEGGTRVVESEEELITGIQDALAQPEEDQEGRKALLKRVVTYLDGSSTRRWTEAVRELLK